MAARDVFAPFASSRTLAWVLMIALMIGAYATLPALMENSRYRDYLNIPSEPHVVLSLVISWLLVFRTNAAYSRWWEARTLWGALVNASRNIAIKLTRLGKLNDDEVAEAAELVRAFPVALKCHLRSESDTRLPAPVRALAPEAEHVPQALANQLYAIVGRAKEQGRIDGDELRVIDAELLRLMDICGGCERILKTRIVKSYRIFARQCVLIFLLSLPWGIVDDFKFWTLPMTVIIAYFMVGLETVAEHVEEPFGYDEDDLDLDGLCRTIDRSVSEVFDGRIVNQPT